MSRQRSISIVHLDTPPEDGKNNWDRWISTVLLINKELLFIFVISKLTMFFAIKRKF